MKYSELIPRKAGICTVCMFKNLMSKDVGAEAHLIFIYQRHPDPISAYKYIGTGLVVDSRDSDTSQHAFEFEMDENPGRIISLFENIENSKVNDFIRAITTGGEMENSQFKMTFRPLKK